MSAEPHSPFDEATQRVLLLSAPTHVTRARAAAMWLLGIVGFGTAAALVQDVHWILGLFSHFPLHLAIGAVMAGIAGALGRQKIIAVASCLFFAWNLFLVWPRHQAFAPSPQAERIKLLVLNVNGRGVSYDEVLRLLRVENPDVIALLEVTNAWATALSPVLSTYGHGTVWARDDLFGLALVSRLPLTVERKVYAGADLPTILGHLATSSGSIHFGLAHFFMPVAERLHVANRTQLAAYVGAFADEVDGVVLLGDFNLTPWTYTMRAVSESLGLREAPRSIWHGTWPSFFPALRIPIDNVLVGRKVGAADLRVGPDVGSDHRPLIVTLGRSP